MKFDPKLLVRERQADMFSVPPISIGSSLAALVEPVRDRVFSDPEKSSLPGVAICRVIVRTPSARMRQRLAILDWAPEDPAFDDVWFIDEPITLPATANAEVAVETARAYADELALLAKGDDGVFEGRAPSVRPDASTSAKDLVTHVKLLAERRFVAIALVGRHVPVDRMVTLLRRDVVRTNAARIRAGLPPLSSPSVSTVGRWRREFEHRHRDRAGLGRKWRSYEETKAALRATSPTDGNRLGEAEDRTNGLEYTSAVKASRLDRARLVRDQVLDAAATHGRWESRSTADGSRTGRVLEVDTGAGWNAIITTPFSGFPRESATAGSYDDAVLLRSAPKEFDVAVDVWVQEVGKVLSIGRHGEVDTLVGMTPGPWETWFDLPTRDWPPAVARRLAHAAGRRAATVTS